MSGRGTTPAPDQADDILTILHVSDSHFGMPDTRAEMPRITDALVTAAHKQSWIPDIIVFSGDLAFKGATAEFQSGLEWLERLGSQWPDARFFIVPGNHDVDRNRANLILRRAYVDEDAYSAVRGSIRGALNHLAEFLDRHAEAKQKFGERLLSDWSDPFGCHAVFSNIERRVHMIGLNTALLSCDNDDKGKLVQDIATINQLLGKRCEPHDCVVAVGHHPLSWLAEWNCTEVGKLLRQVQGANVYLHGHQHEQTVSALSSATGQSLAILECGAAYQGSRWPQYFSFYKLVFDQREIEPKVFLYSPGSGDWVKDNQAFPIVAPLPPLRPRRQRLLPSGQAEPQRHPPIEADLGSDNVELAARRAIEVAEVVHRVVRTYIDQSNFIDRPIYSVSSRVKDLKSVIRKVVDRRIKGDTGYHVGRVTDICGVRYVTLFQSDIPFIISKLLYAIPPPLVFSTVPFRIHDGVDVTVHSSRPPRDPLSIQKPVEDAVQRWGRPAKLESRSSSTGYSSVHLVVHSVATLADGVEHSIPVEFQVRSVLEEVWGQLDHKLRYETSRGTVGDNAWQRHLNVLKSQYDAMIQYIDLIKETAEGRDPKRIDEIGDAPERPAASPSTLSLATPEAHMRALAGLPPQILRQLNEAFELWKDADASRQFGGDENKFRKAADAFLPFIDGCPSEVTDKDLSLRLSYGARMERAYMLFCTGGEDDTEEARAIYARILQEWPHDTAAVFRLGQVLRGQGRLEEAVGYLERAIEIIQQNRQLSLLADTRWVYEFARIHLALTHFRRFELGLPAGSAAASIKMAVVWARQVLQDGTDPAAKRQALNDVVYYAWEERKLLVNEAERWTLLDQEFRAFGTQFMRNMELDTQATFREFDTLARLHDHLGDKAKGLAAARDVCLKLEAVARGRSKSILNIEADRFGVRWVTRVVAWLRNEDERDALLFAVSLIEQSGD